MNNRHVVMVTIVYILVILIPYMCFTITTVKLFSNHHLIVCIYIHTELPSFELNITTSGSTQLSEDFNMTCSVVMVPGLVGDFSVVWKKMDEVISNNQQSNISIVTNVNGPVTNVTLVLSPVKFEHRGIYKCVAEYSSAITNDNITISDDYQLTVSCKFVFKK